MARHQLETLTRPASDKAATRPASSRVIRAVIAVQGAALAVLLGLDGSPLWQVVRVLAVVAVSALAVWYCRAARRPWRGLTLLVLGVAGTVAGAGVAIGHLAAGRAGAAAAVAVLALVTGLFLLTAGAVDLIRATPRWWRLLAIPAVLALIWFVLLPLAMAVYATNRAPEPLGSGSPARYGLSYRDVAFRTAAGIRLSGWYIPARNGAAVLLLPGSGSDRTAVLPQAAVLARHGYGALLIDPRGHGRSGGHAMEFGWWGGPDITAAVSFLARQPGVQAGRIAVLGESMGGEQALAAIGTDPLIRAVVAEGVTGQQLADHGWLPGGVNGLLERGMEWVQYTAAGLLSGAPRPMSIPDSLRAAASRPALIIAGGAKPDEPAAARWFKAAAPAAVRIWVVPRAGHTQGLATEPRAWTAHVIGFLDSALRP